MSTETKSYEEHDAHYETYNLEQIKIEYKQKTLDKDEFKPDQPLGELLKQYNNKLKIAIDIGSGLGWFSNLLSSYVEKVYSIEPSLATQNIAKQICGDVKNIEYLNGFAETELKKLIINKPTLFIASCVLSHLSDDTVISICKQINKMSVEGSVFSFSENWSEHGSIQEPMWYSRNKDWWKEQFPNWDIIFNTTYPSNRPGMYKGFWGVKQKAYIELGDEEFWDSI